MAIFRWNWRDPSPLECRGPMLTVGNFDGVHRGHAALLARLRSHADRVGSRAVVLTFDPHPLLLLRPQDYQPTLTTLEDRAQLLQENGADHVIVLETRPDLLQLSADDFLQKLVRQNLQARGLVEGPNFRFGHDRQGDVKMLTRFCAEGGMVLEIVQPLTMDGGMVSSNRIRQALVAGDVSSAARWLGRPYRLAGVVAVGARRGQTLGFPTANLAEITTLVPGDGVYAVHAWYHNVAWPAAANVGPNPTFGELARKVEVHLIGFEGDVYGKSLTVDFLAKLRDTRRFESVEQLKTQIEKDIAQARDFFSEPPADAPGL